MPTGIILHIHTQGNLQTCSTHTCRHRRREPQRLGSHGNPCSDMYSPTGIHTHAGRDTDTFTCIQPQKALHASKQGIPWGWAQCPHPRWHRHEVINAANRHQLPRSLPAAAGRGSRASWAWGCVPRCQQRQGPAHPIVPAGPWGIPIWQGQHLGLGEAKNQDRAWPRSGPGAPTRPSKRWSEPTQAHVHTWALADVHTGAHTHRHITQPKQTPVLVPQSRLSVSSSCW